MKISIVVPNFNYDKYISRTLDSILSQAYSPKELIVVDDGSTDDSWSIIKKYAEENPKIIRALCQENSGQVSAINRGLEQATGEIVGWINSDDTYCDSAFEQIMEVFSKNDDIEVVFGNINIIDDKDNFIHELKHFKYSYFKSVFLGFSNTTSSNAVFWRREVMDKTGYLNPAFKCGLDNDFFSRLTYKAKVFHLDTAIANYRKQPITKAAIGNPHWSALVIRESEIVFESSYNNLRISKYLPYAQAKYLKFIIVNLRRFSKLSSGRMFKILIQKHKYNKKHK